MRTLTFVQHANGGPLYAFEQDAYESEAEYDGRLLCAIEDYVLGGQPRGARWIEWSRRGHAFGYAWGQSDVSNPDGSNPVGDGGTMWEHTGNRYVDRKVRVPGLYARR